MTPVTKMNHVWIESIVHKGVQLFKQPLLHWPMQRHVLLGTFIRLFLVIYGCVHDRLFELRYTDIDYLVFTDGARYVAQGRSPFLRHGYRYTPLFAYMALGNVWIISIFGKLLFVLFDVLTGHLIYRLLRHSTVNVRERPSRLAAAFWLYNPLPLVVSTRGSSDSVVTFLVLLSLYLVIDRRWALAGLTYGLVVHCKLYPIIYAPALYLFLSGSQTNRLLSFSALLPLNGKKLIFFSTAAISFLATTYVCYARYGKLYADEAWLYHLQRQDLTHNFSPYFYLYQLSDNAAYQQLIGYLAFVPQLVSILYLSVRHTVWINHKHPQYRLQHLFFSLFTITYLFVSLNKVCTSQYFLWYLCLLPLVTPYLDMDIGHAARLLNTWLISQGNKLLWVLKCNQFN